jgi:hypothetical protein
MGKITDFELRRGEGRADVGKLFDRALAGESASSSKCPDVLSSDV